MSLFKIQIYIEEGKEVKFQGLSLQLAAPHGISFAVAYNVCFITMTGDPPSKKSPLVLPS